MKLVVFLVFYNLSNMPNGYTKKAKMVQSAIDMDVDTIKAMKNGI